MRPRTLLLTEDEKRELARVARYARRQGSLLLAARCTAVLQNSRGKTSGELAQRLGVSRSRVSGWLAKYERDRLDGILPGKQFGRPPLLTSTEVEKLLDIVLGSLADDYARRKWGSIPPGWC